MEIPKTQQNNTAGKPHEMTASPISRGKSFVSIIAAISKEKRALGKGGALLWHIPDDLKRFKETTLGHPVIMGRKTWESLPPKFRPLPERKNILITRNKDLKAPGAIIVNNIEEAIKKTENEEVFVIGGGEIYKEALPLANRLYLTIVEEEKEADTFFPDYSEFKKEVSRECFLKNNPPFCFVVLEK
ncbi:MAG: dihydrofolate reductase [Patescibacteria group bacterium]